MRDSSIPDSIPNTPQETVCPRCGARLGLESPPPDARLSDPVAHALIDRLISVQDQFREIKKLVEGEVLP
jgi:hypothetical protein